MRNEPNPPYKLRGNNRHMMKLKPIHAPIRPLPLWGRVGVGVICIPRFLFVSASRANVLIIAAKRMTISTRSVYLLTPPQPSPAGGGSLSRMNWRIVAEWRFCFCRVANCLLPPPRVPMKKAFAFFMGIPSPPPLRASPCGGGGFHKVKTHPTHQKEPPCPQKSTKHSSKKPVCSN